MSVCLLSTDSIGDFHFTINFQLEPRQNDVKIESSEESEVCDDDDVHEIISIDDGKEHKEYCEEEEEQDDVDIDDESDEGNHSGPTSEDEDMDVEANTT
ncbi:hypothetical protein DMENIID0001_140710 [Sergentomyia squamirostris]